MVLFLSKATSTIAVPAGIAEANPPSASVSLGPSRRLFSGASRNTGVGRGR